MIAALIITVTTFLAPGTVLEDQTVLITQSHVTFGAEFSAIPQPPII